MKISAKTPKEYIESLEEPRKTEIATLDKAIHKALPHLKREMGYGIGYGPYHYEYKSGRQGDTHIISLASQKNYISLYVFAIKDDAYIAELHRDTFPKASIGKSCIRFKRLSDMDMDKLIELCKEAAELMLK